ncbi:MAG: hypothetical protein AAGD33_02090 [Actinomycetota bacterium]
MDARGLRRSALAAIAFIVVVGLAAVAPAGATGGSPAPRQVDAETYIDVLIDAPPAVRDALVVQLTTGGTDVSSSCAADGPDPGDQRRSIRCDDLDDGTYALDVIGVPAGHVELWDCTDIVAASAEHTAIPIGGGFSKWLCSVTVAEPGVRLEWSTTDDRSLGVATTPDGSTTADCIDDVGGGFVIRWCAGGIGAYDIEIVGEVGDESVDLFCFPVITSRDTFDDTAIVVTADEPLWTCSLQESPQAVGSINWVAVAGDTASWLTSDALALTGGPVGADLDGRCELVGAPSVETENDFTFSCDGLPSGTYSIDLVGVPPGHRVDLSLCPPFVIDDTIQETQAGCQIDVFTPAWIAGDAGLPPPDGSGDGDGDGDDELPVAGGTVHLLFLLGALITGVGLLVLSAPRLIPVRVDRRAGPRTPVHSEHDRNAVHHR